MKKWIVFVAAFAIVQLAIAITPAMSADTKLWDVYNNVLKKAKYVDLTHAFSLMFAKIKFSAFVRKVYVFQPLNLTQLV